MIHAEGELQASEKLLQAAEMLAKKSEAMQLRYLQTLTTIAGDKASTIVFPIPMDVLGPLLGRKPNSGSGPYYLSRAAARTSGARARCRRGRPGTRRDR